jgi:replication factor C small subunit
MESYGQSSLWVERYRPKTVNDLILPDSIKNFFNQLIKDKSICNLLFHGPAGQGKTASAYAIAKDIGADVLYINGSIDTSIDIVRYKVQSFAMTSSLSDSEKICILDESDRLSANAQDSLKSLIESTEKNCRFIFTTNNLSKIIDPIKSRCQVINFNFPQKDTKNLIINYFKRICWILDNEKISYDKKVVAEFIQKSYPDFRKMLNELQKYAKMHNKIDESIYATVDGSILSSLVEELKAKKFNNVRKLATEIDSASFYGDFYKQIDSLLEDKCKPDVITILGQYAYESALSVNPEITLVSCLVQLMKTAIWRF